jgi:hypothetical protein
LKLSKRPSYFVLIHERIEHLFDDIYNHPSVYIGPDDLQWITVTKTDISAISKDEKPCAVEKDSLVLTVCALEKVLTNSI